MKKVFLFSIVVLGGLIFMNFSKTDSKLVNPPNDKYEVPEDVQAIIDKSCKGCHVSDSKKKIKLGFNEKWL